MPKLNQEVLVMIVKRRLENTPYRDLVTEEQILRTTQLYLSKTLTKAVESSVSDLLRLCKKKEKKDKKSLAGFLGKAFTRSW